MIGNVVGSYKITDKIGEGGMGAVFRGIDIMLEREVAIKMLRPELSSQPNIVERFRSEAITLAKLNHPNIATLYSFVRQGEDFFMVMEFVRGDSLDRMIRKNGAMTCERAVRLMCQALEGIDHAHKMGIIHRDIKPANMMLTENGTLKVMDFGIARVLGTARMTKQGNIVGTIEYMSPEQVRGLETDARSDIYSLGILLYEMLTGRVPFASDSEYDLMKMQIEDAPPPPRVFVQHIPPALEQAIMRSLAKRQEARFATAGEFRDVLLSAIGTTQSPGAAQAQVPPTRVEQVSTPTIAFGSQGTRPANVATSPFGVDHPKETRLASDQHQAMAYPNWQPPVADQPAPPKSNVGLFIGIGAAVFVLLVGAVIAYLLMQKPEPQKTPQNKEAQTASPVAQPSTQTPAAQSPSSNQVPSQSIPQPDSFKPPERVPTIAVTPVENSNAGRVAKTSRKENDSDAAARREKARKAAEARKLLSQ